MADVTPFSGLSRPFFLSPDVFDLEGSSYHYIDVNNCDTIGKSQLKFVKLCTRTHELQC